MTMVESGVVRVYMYVFEIKGDNSDMRSTDVIVSKFSRIVPGFNSAP